MKFKLLLNIVFIFVTQIFLGQDSLLNKIQHVFAVEFQYTPSQSRSKSDGKHGNETFVSYNYPGINLFYNLIIPNNSEAATLFSGGVFYRNGYLEGSNYGPGSSQFTSGPYEVIRTQMGVSEFSRLGKRRGFNFGGGFNFGWFIYTNSDIHSRSSDGSGGNVSQAKISEVLVEPCISINLEVNQSIKLTKKKYLTFGLKQYLELPDVYGAPLNLTTGFYIGYKFK